MNKTRSNAQEARHLQESQLLKAAFQSVEDEIVSGMMEVIPGDTDTPLFLSLKLQALREIELVINSHIDIEKITDYNEAQISRVR